MSEELNLFQYGTALLASGGLSRSTVDSRHESEGLNELPLTKQRRILNIIGHTLQEPMVYLLLGCGLIYLFIGDLQEALMLLGFLIVILGITVTQENKAERALEALRDLSSPRAMVYREGSTQRVAGREVVREDILLLNEGDRVSADAVVLTAQNASLNESMLTGESQAVDKFEGDLIFAGTTIVAGQCQAYVVAIGVNTKLGSIGKSLTKSVQERTKLETQTRALVKTVSWISGSLCLLVVFIYGLNQGNWLEGFLAGLTLAMAILPNELPAVLTIFLALGAWRLSQRRVLTRKLPAVETLGSATVLCVDKTGTLTLNQMSIQKIYAGGVFVDLTTPQTALDERFHETLEFGILASRQEPVDPMEVSFIVSGNKYLEATEHLHHDWKLEKAYPLSPELLAISQAWRPSLAGNTIIGAKGAPEAIIDLCHLSAEVSAVISDAANAMAREGLRVLGVAKASSSADSLPEKQHDFEFEFVGLVGLADPIRPEVPQAVAECMAAGIKIIMITGDHSLTASTIARRIGLSRSGSVITGEDLKQLSPLELEERLTDCQVFSRIMPEQKLQLVEALKARGEIVAMTGDGVNDAPALRSAHIGIAMGKRGTDVARESASIVLLDDDFTSIVESIRLGRRIFANLRSALIYLLAVHIPIAGISIFPVMLDLPLVLMPSHVALLHLIIEPASSLAFEVEAADAATMQRPPRDPGEKLFDKKLLLPCFFRGLSVLVALLIIFLVALHRGQGEKDARALVFTTLIIASVTLIFTSRGKFDFNRTITWIVFGSVSMLGIVLYVPAIRRAMQFSFLHPVDLGLCLGVGILSVILFNLLPTTERGPHEKFPDRSHRRGRQNGLSGI